MRRAASITPKPSISITRKPSKALAEGKTWTAQAHSLSLLTTYEGRITRRAEKNLAQLTEMQTRRRYSYAQAQKEAIRLVHLAQAAGEVYEPAADFEPASAMGSSIFSPRNRPRPGPPRPP